MAAGGPRPGDRRDREGGGVTNGYDSRGATLDPGLTALALRARARPDETYAFVPRRGPPAWWQRAWAAANRPLGQLRTMRPEANQAA
jgi:hypothetical protein